MGIRDRSICKSGIFIVNMDPAGRNTGMNLLTRGFAVGGLIQ